MLSDTGQRRRTSRKFRQSLRRWWRYVRRGVQARYLRKKCTLTRAPDAHFLYDPTNHGGLIPGKELLNLIAQDQFNKDVLSGCQARVEELRT